MDIEKSVALVTGGASGLGAATVQALVGGGGRAVIVDRDAATGQELARSIGNAVRFVAADVTSEEDIRKAIATAREAFGGLNVTVNCAGVGRFANSHEMPFEDWQRILNVNLTGTFLVCQAALRCMIETGRGSIVNIASNAGLMGQAYSAAYCASKGGVVNLTRALADEYIDRGIRVNCVAPGGIATPLQKAFYALPEGADPNKLGKVRSPFGNSTPEEIAELVAFVASDQGRYMTGSIVSIDGGITT